MRPFPTHSLSCHLLLAVVVLAATGPLWAETAAFITPDGQTHPFENWSRGDADSSFAFFEDFTPDPTTGGVSAINRPNSSFGDGLPDANLVENSGQAFVTSSKNIYSPVAPIEIEATVPSFGRGAGYDTRLVAQIGTLGSRLDSTMVLLTYEGADGPVTVAADHQDELAFIELSGGFGGDLQESLYVWDLAGWNAGEYVLEFAGAEASTSLDNLAIDLFVSVGSAPGDFNASGAVDADDYALWRSQYGTTGPEADGNFDGLVDAADYTLWRDQMQSSGGLAASSVVPEPGALQLSGLFGLTLLFCVGTHWSIAPRHRERNR